MLSQVAILAADTCRSRIYLQHLRSKGLVPSFALVLSQASDRHLLTNIDKEILRKDNKYSYNLETQFAKYLRISGYHTKLYPVTIQTPLVAKVR